MAISTYKFVAAVEIGDVNATKSMMMMYEAMQSKSAWQSQEVGILPS